MMKMIRVRRALLALLLVLPAVPLAALPGQAQTVAQCSNEEKAPEEFGPTDITATSGNQRLTAAVNSDATVTVLKWPSPSFYDQIKYKTTDRAQPRMGALPNEGAFLGLAWRAGSTASWAFSWLRTWSSSQSFTSAGGDEVRTTFRNNKIGLKVTVRDVVAAKPDALIRRIKVTREADSRVRQARVISFANFNPVVSKTRQSPTSDWCTESRNDAGAEYLEDADALIHERTGLDQSTGDPTSVALMMGFASASSQHQVGADSYESGAGLSAYDDASDGELAGAGSEPGQADGALADDLSLRRSTSASTTAILVAAADRQAARSALAAVRASGPRPLSVAKARWWKRWLGEVPVPKAAPRSVLRLSLRALISVRQATARSGLIVASVSTQPPRGLDWLRHGAYINRALDVAGHGGMVRRHNLRYAELQVRTGDANPENTPPGNWAESYYSDGIPGGPAPYEIDSTGLGMWTLWDHYAMSGDGDYLLRARGGEVYQAIQRAAVRQTEVASCKDPFNNLQCRAHEEGSSDERQTLVGAQSIWLGMESAVKAAKVRNTAASLENARRWNDRAEELRAAIRAEFFDEACGCYTRDPGTGGTFLWPVRFAAPGSKASAVQATQNWKAVRRAMDGQALSGGDEVRALLGNAHAWADSGRQTEKVRTGLRWVAEKTTTAETGLLGEAWARSREGGPIRVMVAQPHVPSQAIFYLAALKAYGKERWGD